MRLAYLVIGLMLAFAPPGLAQPAVGERISDTLEVLGFKVPLPAGTWQVFYSRGGDNADYPRADVGLVLLNGQVIARVAQITVARALKRDGFKPYQKCKLAYYVHSHVRVNRHGRDQECRHIRSVNLARGEDPTASLQALFAFADQGNLFLPVAMVGARFHLANRDAALRAAYSWNPDLLLPARTREKVWVFEDWVRDAVAIDPRKAAVMITLDGWAEEWLPAVQEALAAGIERAN